jgi:hypothetical protein
VSQTSRLSWLALPAAALAFAVTLPASPAGASPASAVSRVRSTVCAPGVRGELRETRELDAIALRLARGDSLHTALASAKLRPAVAASMHLIGLYDDRSLATAISARFCRNLADPRLSEIGVSRSERAIWIVVAAPLELPDPQEQRTAALDVLVGVNHARATGHRCGSHPYPPAAPVRLAGHLSSIARAHSDEMARVGRLDHSGVDGSSPGDRVRRSGYLARVVGENIAGGVPSAEEVVQGWLDSPEHCANIMDPRFTEMGLAFAINASSPLQIYWTQLFALPRSPSVAMR